MLNFRKLKQEFSHRYLSKNSNTNGSDFDAIYILSYSTSAMKIRAQMTHNTLEQDQEEHFTELEIDLKDSSLSDAKCSKCCSSTDCVHVINTVLELESNFDVILSKYSNQLNDQAKKAASAVSSLITASQQASSKQLEEAKQDVLEMESELELTSEHVNNAAEFFASKKRDRQMNALIHDYSHAYNLLVSCAFFNTAEHKKHEPLSIVILFSNKKRYASSIPIRLAIKVGNGKPKPIAHIEKFFNSCKTFAPFKLGNATYIFSDKSFDPASTPIFNLIKSHLQVVRRSKTDGDKLGVIDRSVMGEIIKHAISNIQIDGIETAESEKSQIKIPGIFLENLQTPLFYNPNPIKIVFEIKKTDSPLSRVILTPSFLCNNEYIPIDKCLFMESSSPFAVYNESVFGFTKNISPAHIGSLHNIQNIAIPEALFGTLIEHALPIMHEYASLEGQDKLMDIHTVPNAEPASTKVLLRYWEGALEAKLFFMYSNDVYIPGAHSRLTPDLLSSFYTPNGIISRAIYKEQEILRSLFGEFALDAKSGTFFSKDERVIIDFMSKVIPEYESSIIFEHEYTLKMHFTYDNTVIHISIDTIDDAPNDLNVNITVHGELYGTPVSFFMEAIPQGKFYIEQNQTIHIKANDSDPISNKKFLIFNQKKITDWIPILNILNIDKLENSSKQIPSWKLPIIKSSEQTTDLHINLSEKAMTMYHLMVDSIDNYTDVEIPTKHINAELRSYQISGIRWIHKLRSLKFNGILADDMGLGKTLQIISSLLQQKLSESTTLTSLVICPTSLIYNWGEECNKFTKLLSFAIVKGAPSQRAKIIGDAIRNNTDIIITSYALSQKDLAIYKDFSFNYLILDEAQLIKNHKTLNAQTVRQITANYKLAVTGTPVENSLSELWSILDFLMPGLLGKREIFMNKYAATNTNMSELSASIAPFMLRRMKKDVLSELPPIYEISLSCQLSKEQERLYKEFAHDAKRDLSNMIQTSGFEKSKIHILGALTRLRQICCHPGIFAHELRHKKGVSEKYDLLINLLSNLSRSGHKTVVFSQYTQMLHILHEDLLEANETVCYLDGNTTAEDRISLVNEFNNNENIPIFLASTKAGGVGLNLTGADTVIHYDLSWNPATENQASDRIHRIGQKKQVFVYKIITKNTIEDKIIAIQKAKQMLIDSLDIGFTNTLLEMSWEEILDIFKLD